GGAVLLSPACVCVAFRFRRTKGRTLHDFFAAGTGYIREVLREHYGLELVERGISDLAHAGPRGLRKVMGCSLYMPRDFALYLASLLVSPDFGEIARYLAHPSREPDYRAGRGHEDFLVGLNALVGHPLGTTEVSERLGRGLDEAMHSQLDWTDSPLSP
ncbi:MAG TPA: hypothetical protein VK465_11255, partial [Fibrobacteria bacterium]|nr:hypothetical protein [Fibrobacteria bacterium]